MMAERWPASGWPMNSQFFLPIAEGRMAFSIRLLSSRGGAVIQVRGQRRPVFEQIMARLTQAGLRQYAFAQRQGELSQPAQRPLEAELPASPHAERRSRVCPRYAPSGTAGAISRRIRSAVFGRSAAASKK
ncbi:MAG: hypothetical protein WDM96_09805 [Lacunisphaera sp.]